jgi:hypothetical protein
MRLSLAFDVVTMDLLCAFTEPARIWVQSALELVKIEEQASYACTFSRAEYKSLRSTVAEVLQVLWHEAGVDPSTTGQIVLRPRYATCTLPAKRVENQLIPLRAPTNEWIVEVLGGVVLQRGDWRATTLVARIHDADLKIRSRHYMD